LLLGAKWFDSDERTALVFDLIDDDDRFLLAIKRGEELPPTAIARRWVAVTCPDGRGPERWGAIGRGIRHAHRRVSGGGA
jgi:hypothetical protein